MIFRKILCFWSITYVSFRFFSVFHVLIKFWSIAYGALEFRLCFFGDFSTFERVSLILDGSDPEFNTVLVRSPNVFGIFSVQIPRFLAEIYDFEQFSWAPVHDFSKNTLFSNITYVSFRFFSVFHVLIRFWSVTYSTLEFR